jgi:hypothetical protein
MDQLSSRSRFSASHSGYAHYMATIDEKRKNESARRDGRAMTWVNWVLAVLTVPAAAAVMFFATGQVMGTAGCSEQACRGPSDLAFGVMFYGAPVVAVIVLAVSVMTARRRLGTLVPLAGFVLLAVDAALLAGAFN